MSGPFVGETVVDASTDRHVTPAHADARIGYGVVVGSWDKMRANILPWVGDRRRPLCALSGQRSIAAGFNAILRAFAAQELDAVILLHDDLEILDADAEAKFVAALADPGVALVGVAGGVSGHSLHWWRGPKVGHQYTDSGLLDFGSRSGEVAFIEGSIMVFSPWAVQHLRFDERYEDFSSGYDDICLHALKQGKRNVVVDVSTHHHTQIGWKSAEREAKFEQSERAFQAKWWGR